MANAPFEVPHTESIKYIGSKLRLLPYILQMTKCPDIATVLDAFSGSTRVSQALAQCGFNVTANDLSEWSEVLGNCYLMPGKPDAFYQEILDGLNSLPGYDGWFTEHYGGDSPEGKMPFKKHNTRKLDAIRDRIDTLEIDFIDKCVLLTSLMRALDEVDNTLGHYVSYLSGWSSRSERPLRLELPSRFSITTDNHVIRGDAFEAIKT